MNPAGEVMALGGRLGRAAAAAAADAAGRTALAGLDALLGWRYMDEALRRVLASTAADRAVGHALTGPLVESVARDVARYAVLERVADRLLEGPELERVATRVIESRPARHD